MRTLILTVIGLALLGATVAIGRIAALEFAALRPWFTGLWALVAAVNLYVGTAFVRQPIAAEIPGFLVTAALPIAAAYVVQRVLAGRGRGRDR